LLLATRGVLVRGTLFLTEARRHRGRTGWREKRREEKRREEKRREEKRRESPTPAPRGTTGTLALRAPVPP
jgi:hypothetical protein